MTRYRARYLLAVLLSLATNCVAAQAPLSLHQTEASARSQLLGERNRMGLVEFCSGLHLLGEDVVAAQRRVLEGLHGPNDVGVEEEIAGRKGLLAFMKTQGTFAESAQAQGITVETKCQQLAISVPR